MCWFRIRVLHTQLLEKDAVIKVLHQRSRLEQGRLEKQGLRLARSVPSINTVSASTTAAEVKGSYCSFIFHTLVRNPRIFSNTCIKRQLADGSETPDRMYTS